MCPTFAFAVQYDPETSGCDYYKVVSNKEYKLAPGATESEIVLTDENGDNRNVMHTIEVDLTNPDISVMPTYMGLKEGIDFEDSSNWGSQVLTGQAAHVENDLGLNVVGGVNTNLRYDSDHPYGVLVWNGVVYSDERNANGNSTAQTYLVVDKEGNAELRSASEPLDGSEWQAVSANFGWIIKDGVSQYATDDHNDANRAPRTVLGIKADGSLLLMMNDGRQSPYSAGMTMRELAEVLLAMGCVNAVNCDGGGSSTFISEREGSGELTMKSSPSDGGQRATLGGLLVISNAKADGEFDHATVQSSENYVTPGSTVSFSATGADSAGGPADIPAEGVTWQLEDSSLGTVEDGVFTSNGKVGKAVVQMVYGGEVVGQDFVNVVIPEEISFVQSNMTVPFGKTAELTMRATVNNGLNKVTLKADDIKFELSDEALGTIDGLNYTACEEGSVETSSGNITATLVHDETVTAVATLNLGKGSKTVWDFENGDISNLSFGTGYASKHAAHPELGRFEFGSMEVVTADSGQVKHGDKALALTCDFSNFYAMGYNMLKLSGLDVDLTDAVRVGFWVYLTPEATGLELDFENWYEFNHGDAGSGDMAEEGWYYVSVDATKITKKVDGKPTFDTLNLYHTDGYDQATNENLPNIKTEFTIYVDDITVDYSTVVEDREAPKFNSVSVLKNADAYEEMDGQTVSSDTVTVMAEAKDDTTKNNSTGLDTSSAEVYVDGVKLTESVSCASNGSISVDQLKLSEGIHTFRFEIADNAGNYRGITRQVVVDATDEGAPVSFVPADPELDKLPIGSVYYMDLKASNAENVKSVTTVVNLDGSNDWQLEHMDVAKGFEADYSIDKFHNNATITLTKTGKADVSGDAVLASIPIRVWEFTVHKDYPDCVSDGKGVCNFVSTPAQMWSGDGQFRIAVCASVIRGEVEFVDGGRDTFSSKEYVIDTEMDKHRNIITQAEKNAKTSWHIHRVGDPQDKAATCTEAGYNGRTFCVGCACGNTAENPCDTFEGCGSVVDWGTAEPAKGHSYSMADGAMKCSDCKEILDGEHGGKTYIDGVPAEGWISESFYVDGAKLKGVDKATSPDGSGEFYYDFGDDGICKGQAKFTGLFEKGGKTYYSVHGSLKSGWNVVESGSDYYYFDASTFAALDGEQTIDGHDYVFENCVLVKGHLYRDDNGKRYFWAGKPYAWKWFEVDGKKYYAAADGYVVTGFYKNTDGCMRVFNEEGVWLEGVNGLYEHDGKTYYVQKGVMAIRAGLVEIDGSYYYFNSSNTAVKDCTYWVSKTNGLFAEGSYEFDADGKMVVDQEDPDDPVEPEAKDGVSFEDDGVYYYKNGSLYRAGLVEHDGSFYYFNSTGKAVTGTYWVSLTNGLVAEGSYEFDADGKMVVE